MKKTLIALLALAGCAMGAVTLEDAIGTVDSTTTALTFNSETSNSYYMTVVLNDSAITAFQAESSINKTIASLTLGTTNAGLAVGTASGNSKVKASGYVAGTTLGGGNGTYWTNNGMEDTNAIPNISSAEYVTISFGVQGSQNSMGAIVSVYDEWGKLLGSSSYVSLQYTITAPATTDVLTGAAIDTSYITKGYVYSGSYDKDTLVAASSAAVAALVPEPTTATLSLLALAGLAARRRRK